MSAVKPVPDVETPDRDEEQDHQHDRDQWVRPRHPCVILCEERNHDHGA